MIPKSCIFLFLLAGVCGPAFPNALGFWRSVPAKTAPALVALEGDRTVVRVPPRINPKTCPPPSYPKWARRRQQEGKVTLKLFVDAEGGVTKAEFAKKSEHKLLNDAAKEAVENWVLHPALENNKPVPGKLKVAFIFKLKEED